MLMDSNIKKIILNSRKIALENDTTKMIQTYNISNNKWYSVCTLPLGFEEFELVAEASNAKYFFYKNVKKAYLVHGDLCIELPIATYKKVLKIQEKFIILDHYKNHDKKVSKLFDEMIYTLGNYMSFSLLHESNPNQDTTIDEYIQFCYNIHIKRKSQIQDSKILKYIMK